VKMFDHAVRFVIPAAYSLLPPKMNSPEATAMLLAIGLQESEFVARKQRGGGPARGFWQFERGGGVKGVCQHRDTRDLLAEALTVMRYGHIIGNLPELHYAIEDNDVVACVFARLLLFTLPWPLPTRGEHDKAWLQYTEAWRPGKPHRDTWDGNFDTGWARTIID